VIRHETYGAIGQHRVRYACEGDALLVTAAVSVDVSLAGIPLYRRDATYHEEWQGDRLVGFRSEFDDNGEPYRLEVENDGREAVIEGSVGRIEAPATVVSSHPWNEAVVARPLLFDTREGRLQKVQLAGRSQDQLKIEGRSVPATRYRIEGDLKRELWYDASGRWLQSKLVVDGGVVTVTWDGR
jgi:hypothetical protein